MTSERYAYTPKMLAEIWSVTPETVIRLIQTRKLKGFRIGSQYRVQPEDAEAYQAQQTTGPHDAAVEAIEDEPPAPPPKPKERLAPPILWRRP